MEIWKDIPGYEGKYKISTLGSIQSFHGKHKILKLDKNRYGYLQIDLCLKGIKKKHTLHRLIMLTYKGKSNLEVNHKNGIKHDNSIENLEYCTSKENKVHAWKNGIYKVKNNKIVLQFNKKNIFIKEWYSTMNVERKLQISSRSISKCCLGKGKTAGGFIWKYKKNTI